jgi:hypothetical protein
MNEFDVRSWNDMVGLETRLRRLPSGECQRGWKVLGLLVGASLPEPDDTVMEPTAVAVAVYQRRARGRGQTPADLKALTPLVAWDEAWRVAVLWRRRLRGMEER